MHGSKTGSSIGKAKPEIVAFAGLEWLLCQPINPKPYRDLEPLVPNDVGSSTL